MNYQGFCGIVHTNPPLPNQFKQDLAKIDGLKYLEY
jgi:hypothetical protein